MTRVLVVAIDQTPPAAPRRGSPNRRTPPRTHDPPTTHMHTSSMGHGLQAPQRDPLPPPDSARQFLGLHAKAHLFGPAPFSLLPVRRD